MPNRRRCTTLWCPTCSVCQTSDGAATRCCSWPCLFPLTLPGGDSTGVLQLRGHTTGIALSSQQVPMLENHQCVHVCVCVYRGACVDVHVCVDAWVYICVFACVGVCESLFPGRWGRDREWRRLSMLMSVFEVALGACLLLYATSHAHSTLRSSPSCRSHAGQPDHGWSTCMWQSSQVLLATIPATAWPWYGVSTLYTSICEGCAEIPTSSVTIKLDYSLLIWVESQDYI